MQCLYQSFKDKIIKVVHDTPLACHSGYFKTYRKIREKFTWKDIKDDVLKHIRECPTCLLNKYPAGLLQPLPITKQKWETVSMDFITSLPRVQGNDSIFFQVAQVNKYAHFYAITAD